MKYVFSQRVTGTAYYAGEYGLRVSESSDSGTYTLLIQVPTERTLEVGALGRLDFESGWYAYTGSAFGPGGFGRVSRHRELAAGEREARHWHVDYLLGADGVRVDAVVRSPDADIECAVAQSLSGTPVREFGSSDCDCPSHLAHDSRHADLLAAVCKAHRTHGPGEPLFDE